VYECFHCGHKSVIWCSDFSFQEYGDVGEGIYQVCQCTHCGAEITYRIPFDKDEDDDEEPTPPPTPTECMQVLDQYMKAPWEVPMGSLHQALDVLRELAAGADMEETGGDLDM